MTKQDLRSLLPEEVTALFRQEGLEAYRAGQVLSWLQKGARSFDEMTNLSKALREKRAAVAAELQKRIEAELAALRMPSVRFEAEILPLSGKPGFDRHGDCEVRFLMSANAGEKPGRIAQIASGGELSRIMLAMKSVFAQKDPVPAMVFDEIDTGVSGIAAQRVGEKLGDLAAHRQVLCVTHLPQIAAMADAHYSIEKSEAGGRTFTKVFPLDHEGRVREIARLQSGENPTSAMLESAKELLRASETRKSGGTPEE